MSKPADALALVSEAVVEHPSLLLVHELVYAPQRHERLVEELLDVHHDCDCPLSPDCEHDKQRAAAKAALMSWDEQVDGEPGAVVTVQCFQMCQADFDELPEP